MAIEDVPFPTGVSEICDGSRVPAWAFDFPFGGDNLKFIEVLREASGNATIAQTVVVAINYGEDLFRQSNGQQPYLTNLVRLRSDRIISSRHRIVIPLMFPHRERTLEFQQNMKGIAFPDILIAAIMFYEAKYQDKIPDEYKTPDQGVSVAYSASRPIPSLPEHKCDFIH